MNTLNYKKSQTLALIPLLILMFILYNLHQNHTQEPQLEVRPIETISLPPPSVPQEVSSTLKPQLLGIDVPQDIAITIQPVPIDIQSLQPEIEISNQLNSNVSELNLSSQIKQEMSHFDIGQLDQKPVLMSQLHLPSLPKRLIRQGWRSAKIIVHIEIDVQGHAHLIKIHHMDDPSLRKLIRPIIQQAVFTPPTKDGQPVKTAFLWPIRINK